MNIKTKQTADFARLKALLLSNVNVLALVLMIAAFYVMNPAFLNRFNLKNLLSNMAPLLVMACGATYVRLIGSLDLSMGAVCSCANVLLVKLMPGLQGWAYIVALLFGAVTGFLLGVIQARLKVPSFIASLGMMNVYDSVALLISPSPQSVPKECRYLIEWGGVSLGVVSILTIVALLVMIALHAAQKSTPLGRNLNLIGSNQRAARLAGVHVARTQIFAFVVCGITSALAGILLAVKLKSSEPTMGDSFTLLAVAAVLLGGTPTTGGKGSVLMTLTGVMMVVVIQNGMTIVGVDAFWSQIVFGGIILLAMALTSDRKSKNLIVK